MLFVTFALLPQYFKAFFDALNSSFVLTLENGDLGQLVRKSLVSSLALFYHFTCFFCVCLFLSVYRDIEVNVCCWRLYCAVRFM